jgi:hypothetical protein
VSVRVFVRGRAFYWDWDGVGTGIGTGRVTLHDTRSINTRRFWEAVFGLRCHSRLISYVHLTHAHTAFLV